MNCRKLRLGTRGSALALAQAEWVAAALAKTGCSIETIVVKTKADRAPNLPLSEIGDKALWVVDLEQRLLEGAIDLAVHSLKDLPATLPSGLTLGAVPERAEPYDCLVLPEASHVSPAGAGDSRRGADTFDPRLSDPAWAPAAAHYEEVNQALSSLLVQGARVGTSSERRRGQLLLWRPDLEVRPVRGNVDTRLAKLDAGDWDALVLAAAGLRRLGRSDRINALFPIRRMVPAAGQGALGIEIRDDDTETANLVRSLHHGPSAAQVTAERAFVEALGAGCSVPIGAAAVIANDCLELWVRAADPAGRIAPVQDLELTTVPDGEDRFANLEWARELGRRVATRFKERSGEYSALIARAKTGGRTRG